MMSLKKIYFYPMVVGVTAAIVILLAYRLLPLEGEMAAPSEPSDANARLTGVEGDPADRNAPTASTAARRDIQEPTATRIQKAVLKRNKTVFGILMRAGLASTTVTSVIEALKAHMDLSRVPSGAVFHLHWYGDVAEELRKISYRINATSSVVARISSDASWRADLIERPVSISVKSFQGEVTSSLWVSATAAGMPPRIISELADIFAWQIDFGREIRSGDRWRIAIAEKSVDGRPFGWGSILTAEYVNSGKSYRAVRYQDKSGKSSYTNPAEIALGRFF